MIVLLVLFFSLAFYACACYLNYRIVRKFDPAVSYGENLIPIYNYYLLVKQVLPEPGRFVFIMLATAFCGFIVAFLFSSSLFVDLANIIIGIMYARAWGLIAEALGKRFWLHAILAFLSLPLIVTIPIFAFDSSKPVNGSPEIITPPHPILAPPAPPQDPPA